MKRAICMANWRRGSNGHDPTEHQHEKANRKEPNGRLITLRSQLLGAFPVAAANSLLHGSNFQLFFSFLGSNFFAPFFYCPGYIHGRIICLGIASRLYPLAPVNRFSSSVAFWLPSGYLFLAPKPIGGSVGMA